MIILVSDDPDQVNVLSTQLRQKGYLYSTAADGVKALEAARSDRVHLFIIDTGCVSFDGFELCRTIKSDKALAGMPVLLVIGLTDLGRLLAVLDCTADAFISRPIDATTLWSVVSDLQATVEGKIPSSPVTTRFIVTYEGRGYSVIADRRELLEFLLSTFELSVRIRHEQEKAVSKVRHEMQELNGRLSMIAAERDVIVRNLHTELEECSCSIARQITEIQAKDLALTQAGERIKTLVSDCTSLAAAHDTETIVKNEILAHVQKLKEQISSLEHERDGIVQSGSESAAMHSRMRADLEAQLAALREKYATVQQFLDSASRDIGVLNAALADEREKRRAVEERLNALTRENTKKDQAVPAPVNERAAPVLSHNKESTPVLPDTMHAPQDRTETAMSEDGSGTPAVDPAEARTKDREQVGQEPMLPSPPSVQMRLMEPVQAIPLPKVTIHKNEVPVTEPEQPEVVYDGHSNESTPSQPTAPAPPEARMPPDLVVSRERWFDMIKWVHHAEHIPPEEQKELLGDLVRMSRLVQKGRHLTSRQDDEIRALFARILQTGYRFH